jgi:hypothetical protein
LTNDEKVKFCARLVEGTKQGKLIWAKDKGVACYSCLVGETRLKIYDACNGAFEPEIYIKICDVCQFIAPNDTLYKLVETSVSNQQAKVKARAEQLAFYEANKALDRLEE